MANIVIKKRVSLEFLGEDYKEAYLIFKAIPVSEYEQMIPKFDSALQRLDNIRITVEVLKAKFIEGKFPVDGKLADITKEDIGSFDEATLSEAFQYISGQKLDPK